MSALYLLLILCFLQLAYIYQVLACQWRLENTATTTKQATLFSVPVRHASPTSRHLACPHGR